MKSTPQFEVGKPIMINGSEQCPVKISWPSSKEFPAILKRLEEKHDLVPVTQEELATANYSRLKSIFFFRNSRITTAEVSKKPGGIGMYLIRQINWTGGKSKDVTTALLFNRHKMPVFMFKKAVANGNRGTDKLHIDGQTTKRKPASVGNHELAVY